MKPLNVLLVDDSEDQRKLLRLFSEQNGAKVMEAGDGKEAIDISKRFQPDLVILDLMMPVMNGTDALPLIREVSPQSRIVIMSSAPRDEMERNTEANGAVGYIEKSAVHDQLFDEILLTSHILEIVDKTITKSVELPAAKESPREAREFVERALHNWESQSFIGKIQLLISELASNVVEHTSDEMKIQVFMNRKTVRVDVSDQSTNEPVIQQPSDTTASGRGLKIVAELADNWGFDPTESGKTVWFELSRSDRSAKTF